MKKGIYKHLFLLLSCIILVILYVWWPIPFESTKVIDLSGLSKSNIRILQSAKDQLGKTIIYDPSYAEIDFPGGDVPLVRGVCTDVVIRALRGLGYDLQLELNKDISAHFSMYPSKRIWGLEKPDANIDHRRVPNLKTFFNRKKWSAKTKFVPGDIVTWRFDNGRTHIGIISDIASRNGVPYVIHHNGFGVQINNVLYKWKITGHYRMPLVDKEVISERKS